MNEIYIKASDETINEILELVKSKELGKDVKIIDLCPQLKEEDTQLQFN